MTEQITGMVRKGLSKSKVELKSRLLDIETLVTKFLRRTGEMPEASLLASVLANLLDEKTRDMFINDNIMHDYKVMKTRILQIATESDTSTGHMDIGKVSVERAADVYNIATPDNKAPGSGLSTPQSPKSEEAGEALYSAEQGKGNRDANIRCFTCNGLGHRAVDCPMKSTKGGGKGGKPGQWRSQQKGGQYKGSWGQYPKGGKSWGKGSWSKNGPGKGAMSLEEDWGEWYGQEGVPLCGLFDSHDSMIELEDMMTCGACEDGPDEEEVNAAAECECCEWDSEAEPDLQYEDDEMHFDDDDTPAPLEEWPCLPIRVKTLEEEREYIRSRNTPLRLSPDEWVAARKRVQDTVRQFEASGNSFEALNEEPESNAPRHEPAQETSDERSFNMTTVWTPLPETVADDERNAVDSEGVEEEATEVEQEPATSSRSKVEGVQESTGCRDH